MDVGLVTDAKTSCNSATYASPRAPGDTLPPMREVLIVRHAPAGTSEGFARTGQEDSQRPLTAEGREKMARAAAGLLRLVPELSVLWTSPLARARQTAEIVGEVYGLAPTHLPALAPDGEPEAVLAALGRARGGAPHGLVGHEPSLSRLVGWLLDGERRSLVELKKGAACLLGFDSVPRAGAARLLWLLPPRQLRALAKS